MDIAVSKSFEVNNTCHACHEHSSVSQLEQFLLINAHDWSPASILGLVGSVIHINQKQDEKYPIRKVGRHLIYIQTLGTYKHVIARVLLHQTQEMKNELKKGQNLARSGLSGVSVKIEL